MGVLQRPSTGVAFANPYSDATRKQLKNRAKKPVRELQDKMRFSLRKAIPQETPGLLLMDLPDSALLFDGYTLRQVSRLVDIRSSLDGHVVSQ